MKCVACGDHPLNYIHCDRWDCPLLLARRKIEGRLTVSMPDDDGWVEVLDDERDPSPPDEDDDEIAADWDENGSWPSENDETEEEDE